MKFNPYEPPQTVNQPLPMAAEIIDVLPQHTILAIATGHCASAGRMYLIGAAIAWVLMLLVGIQHGADPGARNHPAIIIPGILLAVVGAVFFAWGFLLALVGYAQFRVKPHEPRLRRIYVLIVLQIWFRALLLLVWLFMPDLYFPWRRHWDWIQLLPLWGLGISFLHTSFLQLQGVILLAKLGAAPPPIARLAVYQFTALLLFAGAVGTLYLEPRQHEDTWLVMAGLLATLHLGAYAFAYKNIQRQFQARVALA